MSLTVRPLATRALSTQNLRRWLEPSVGGQVVGGRLGVVAVGAVGMGPHLTAWWWGGAAPAAVAARNVVSEHTPISVEHSSRAHWSWAGHAALAIRRAAEWSGR